MASIRDLLSRLTPDSWRESVGFTDDVERANKVLVDPRENDLNRIATLNEWVQKYQPCLFGTMAAGPSDLISYCLLHENDLTLPDEEIQKKIQNARREWKLDAFDGTKSAFILVAISPKIIAATPNTDLLMLSLQLGSLHLADQVPMRPDERRQDELLLRLVGTQNAQ